MVEVFVGLGSNLDGPIQQVVTAINELAQIPVSNLVKSSSLYKSPPLGPQDQPDFINAVVMLKTELAPPELLDELKKIEQRHGRLRTRHWGERTLDLDLLLYGNITMQTSELTLPHPQMAQRSFVLEPLLEIAPEVNVPGLGRAAALYEHLDAVPLEKVTRS